MSDLKRKFKQFQTGSTSSSAPTQPPPQRNPHIAPNPIDDIIEQYLLGPIPDRYKDLPSVVQHLDRPDPKYDFRDREWENKPAYMLPRYTAQKIAILGRKAIPMLANGFTQQGIGIMFILAYHLRVPGRGTQREEYVFPSPVEIQSLEEDMDIFTLPESQLAPTRQDTYLPATHNIQGEAIAYAFIAASTLRLFSKLPENYVKAFNRIISCFEKFYGFPCPITPPTPSVDALKMFSIIVSNNERYQATLYRILYMSGKGNAAATGMKRFLYEIHLENTGMHIVGIFLKLCEVLNCQHDQLLKAVTSFEYEKEIKALRHLMQIIDSGDKKYEREMWRYGRLFDHAFMSPLRTRSCSMLVYTLASMLKSECSEGNENILDIVQLGFVIPERRRELDKVAAELIARLKGASISE